MRRNPLIMEVIAGLARGGKARLDALPLLLLQAAVLLLWWPGSGVAQMLELQHGPRTLAAVVMALGLTMAYAAVRAGAEEFLLEGQRGLRDWARAASVSPGSALCGYVTGQFVYSLHLLVLSSPLMLMAFTVSGGEWPALGWCLAAALVQALFFRLCGAIAHLMLGAYPGASFYMVRAILLLIYVPVGWLWPVTSHLALTYRTLGEDAANRPAISAVPEAVAFLAIYAGLAVLAAIALHRLLARERGALKGSGDGVGAALTG